MGDDWTESSRSHDVIVPMQTLIESAAAARVFGEPVQTGDRVVIPAAEIWVGLGFGFGSGAGREASPEGNGAVPASGGGGGSMNARPVALIEVGPDGVTIHPVIDRTRLSLAAMVTAVFALFWIARLFRGARAAEVGDAGKVASAIGGIAKRIPAFGG